MVKNRQPDTLVSYVMDVGWQMINILLGLPGARDISQFKEYVDNITGYDKLFVRYHFNTPAYTIMRDFFLSHNEYTHLAILPDDLLAEHEDVYMLENDIKKHDYPVLCGICNVNTFTPHLAAISMDLPSVEREGRQYNWLPFEDVREDDRIKQVAFIGFPLPIIRRDVVEKIPFRTDSHGCCLDVMFSNDCHDNNIPIFMNPSVMMYHLNRDSYEGDMQILVGVKNPEVYLKPRYIDPFYGNKK